MKKSLIIFLIYITVFNCYGIDFKCRVSDGSLIKYRKVPGEGVKNPYDEKEVVVSTDDIVYGNTVYLLVKSNEKYYIADTFLSLSKNQDILDNIILNKRWVPEYCYKALYYKSYKYVFEHEGNIEELYNSGKVDYEIGIDRESYSSFSPIDAGNRIKWYEELNIPFLEKETNISLQFNVYSGTLSSCYLYVTDIDDSKIDIYIYTIYNAYKINIDLNKINENTAITLNYKLDGDYLYLYKNDECVYTFINPSDSFLVQYKNFLQHKNYSLNNITWPRHADGSCDYENKKTTVAPSGSATNVSINKVMTTSVNLKLRSGEATSSNVITVMSAGTKVKILELGKAENIDGINSNWVKVEVQADAKDRDGKPIKKGTIGWCYGGYLR